MKTQIIHLEPHDDVTSAIDKLKWAKAERLVLVWPGRNRILTEKLDLHLIQRQAARRGAQVGVVSLDPDVQAHAESLSIPVFENLSTLHKQGWPENQPVITRVLERDVPTDHNELRSKRKPASKRTLSRPIRITLFALPLLAILLSALLLLPSAEVLITPIRTDQEQSLRLNAVDPIDGTNARLLHVDQVRVEGDIRIATSGVSSEPGEFARGDAEFTNLGEEPVTVPAGTTIRVPGSNQLYFTTQRRVILSGELESTRSVEIVASQPGASGNISAGLITAVDGQLGLLVSVENPEATSGGSVISRNAVSPSDVNHAREELTDRLLSQAEEILMANRLPSEQILTDSLAIQEILFERFDQDEGDIAETLELEMGAIAQLYFVNLEELNADVAQGLSSEINSGEELVPGSLNIQDVQIFDSTSPDTINLQIDANYELYRPLDKSELSQEIRAMQPLAAQRLLSDQYPHNNYSIDLDPGWYPFLPLLEMQISVRYPWEARQ
mgnify:CR=1 FL=1